MSILLYLITALAIIHCKLQNVKNLSSNLCFRTNSSILLPIHEIKRIIVFSSCIGNHISISIIIGMPLNLLENKKMDIQIFKRSLCLLIDKTPPSDLIHYLSIRHAEKKSINNGRVLLSQFHFSSSLMCFHLYFHTTITRSIHFYHNSESTNYLPFPIHYSFIILTDGFIPSCSSRMATSSTSIPISSLLKYFAYMG